MHCIRTILAVMIALSVALLPTAGTAGFMPASNHAADASSNSLAGSMTMASDMDSAMPDCCPDHGKSKPGHASHHCPMVCCGTAVLSIAAPDTQPFAVPILSGIALAIPVDQVLSPHSGSPPFRPPSV